MCWGKSQRIRLGSRSGVCVIDRPNEVTFDQVRRDDSKASSLSRRRARKAPAEGRIMSKPVRLSESRMWQDLRDFYESEGVTAWSSDRLPFFATNNPALARTYVDLFLAYLDDCLLAGQLDLEKPVTIVEIGGGMGRLAYLMLVRLKELADRIPVKVNYLLTDYGQSNVEFYQNHIMFQSFFESGQLAVQQLDAENDQPEISPGNPIFCICNYLFDSLSQDGFRVHNGVLSEAHCSQTESGQIQFSFVEVEDKVYQEPLYNQVLEHYRATLGNTHLPFPIGPLRCLARLSEASEERLAVVMGDKALRTMEELLGFDKLPIQKHDQGFSMSVNCHAIDQVWKDEGGAVIHSAPRDNHLNIALYLKGLTADQRGRTFTVFKDQIDGFGPLDYLDFRAQILSYSTRKSLKLFLQLLRLSRWDPELFYELSNKIGEVALHASLEEKKELYQVMTLCWAHYFPIPDERDLPFAVARVLACINHFQQAIGFYGESVNLYGNKPLTQHNVGICHFNLGQYDEALQAFQAALALDENYGPSKELLLRTEAEVKRLEGLKP